MFDVQYGPVTQKETRYDVQSVVNFKIVGEQSGQSYEGTFTAGSSHDMTQGAQVQNMILEAVARDAELVDESGDRTIKGLVIYLMEESLVEDIGDAFDVAEQLMKIDKWLIWLTDEEREFLAQVPED